MELILNDFVLGVLLTSMFVVLFIGIGSRFFHWKNERKLKQMVIVCRLCGHVFMNTENLDLVECKSCHALNCRDGNGKLG